MNHDYHSDVYEEERAAMRAEGRHLAILAWMVAVMLAILGVALILLPQRARADQPFDLLQPSCYSHNLDYRYLLADGPDAIVWWCAAADGMQENYRAGEVGGIREFLFRIGGMGRDLWDADRQVFVREANDRELGLVRLIEMAGEPRCYSQGAGKSQQVYTRTAEGTLGPAQVDAAGKVVYMLSGERVSCWTWVTATPKRYCLVTGNHDNKQRAIDPGSYALCRVDLAPDEGWQ